MAEAGAATASGQGSALGWLAKERTVAGPGFNRWLVPPAALAIHLCIGMIYGFSVFWLPMSRLIGIKQSLACPKVDGGWEELIQQIGASNCDWKVTYLAVMFQIAIVFLGLAAAVWGGWLERVGPRKAGVVAALCWSGGLAITAVGAANHQLLLMWLGTGVVGGIGLGLGYISPVSTLIKWFPDRRGMATGMAIMGFGGGALVGAPLADWLMRSFAGADAVGVWQTFLVLAVVYLVFMIGGALGYRIPAAGWKPAGWNPPARLAASAMITNEHVHLNQAWRAPQFWLIWAVLCLNVSAGIGILGMASPLLQEVFAGRLIGVDVAFNDLSADQKKQIATIAAGFIGLLSLFNIGGRFFWASLSDRIGRKATYFAFLALGMALYSAIPSLSHGGHLALFVLAFCIILSMYGGGFATVPAYLADMFGTQMVGAIHGRLLTAWSTAGILGPYVVNSLRDRQIESGVPKALVYDNTMYILAGFLLVGFICNLLIRPVAGRFFMSGEQLAYERKMAHERAESSAVHGAGSAISGGSALGAAAAWLAVGIPLGIGILITLQKAANLFR
jgi:MFS family permease